MARRALFFLLAASLVGCTGDDVSVTAPEAGAPTDATVAADAPPSDAGRDAFDASDGAACSTSLLVECATNGCLSYEAMTTPLAAACGAANAWRRDPLGVRPCGKYIEVVTASVDTGTGYFFDATTHGLVAITGSVNGSPESCIAGPPSFVIPSCTDPIDWSVGCRCPPADVSAVGLPQPPPATPTTACTTEQITSFFPCRYAIGDAGPACDRFLDGGASDRSCVACLVAPGGPLRDFPATPNVPGCLALVTGDTSDAGCVAAYGDALDCATLACSRQCDLAPEDARFDCLQRALAGPCATDAAAPCVADAGEACGVDASAADQFRLVATAYCGPRDAGAD